MSRMRDQRRAAKQAKAEKRRPQASQTLEIDEQDIVEELELDLERRMLELES